MEPLPENISLKADAADFRLLSSKSKYEKEYSLFQVWRTENAVRENTEDVFLAYFSQKSRKYKSSSLWAKYSMLKATLKIYENFDLSKYIKLTTYLKQRHVGYKAKKSSVFSKDEIDKFLWEAPDDMFLLIKVAAVVAISGGCRCEELVKLCIGDIDDKGDVLLIHVRYAETLKRRTFTIFANSFGINPIDLYHKYVSLRPRMATTKRLFLNYRRGTCTVQPVGIHSFGKMPTMIAKFLKLEKPESYTGHSFRRSAATLST